MMKRMLVGLATLLLGVIAVPADAAFHLFRIDQVYSSADSKVQYVMNDLADADDTRLEDTVRRRIGDHDRREIRAMLNGLRLEIVEIDVAVAIAGDNDDAHGRHLRGGRIRAVRR